MHSSIVSHVSFPPSSASPYDSFSLARSLGLSLSLSLSLCVCVCACMCGCVGVCVWVRIIRMYGMCSFIFTLDMIVYPCAGSKRIDVCGGCVRRIRPARGGEEEARARHRTWKTTGPVAPRTPFCPTRITMSTGIFSCR